LQKLHHNFTSSFMTSRGEKFNYLEKVNKVPGLKYEAATCSSGRDVREADRLEFFLRMSHSNIRLWAKSICNIDVLRFPLSEHGGHLKFAVEHAF